MIFAYFQLNKRLEDLIFDNSDHNSHINRGGEKIDEIDKIKVTPREFGATHCVLNGDNFCFS